MKTPKPVLERRRSVRIAEKLPFTIGHEDFESEAVTVNLSAHGALCLVEKNFPLMTQFKVALSLPTEQKGARHFKTISMKGVVVRKQKNGNDKHFLIAVYFSNIKPSDRRYLQNFIERRSAMNA